MKRCLCLPIWLFMLPGLAGLQARTLQTPGQDTIVPAAAQSTDWDVAVEALQLSKDAQFIRDSFSRQVARLSAERGVVERALQLAEADSTTDAGQLKTLRTNLKTAQKAEKDSEKNLKRAKTTADFAESVANMDARQQKQQLPKSRKQVLQLKNIFSPPPPAPEKEKPEKEAEKPEVPAEPAVAEIPAKADSTATPAAPAVTEPAEKKRPKTKAPAEPKPLIRTYVAAEDVMITPPALPCSLASSIRDEFSGELRRETPRKELFRYTNQALRKVYSAEKPHTIAEASLLSSGLNASLHLVFRISDPNVRRTQGSLQKGGTATLKFMDGNSIILYDSRSDEGVTDPESQTIVFQAQFPLDRTTIKKLRSTELDRIRLAWTNGYEDYDVQQVDLLMWQAKCLFEQ